MTVLRFPDGFLWGAATGAHQVEGANTGSDWWAWETRPGSTVAEPSGDAIDHLHRYPDDVALLASLGLTAYRFGVEWARIEPEEGVFDPVWLDHYRAMVETVRRHAMTPMVTLHHFTLPRWLADKGGWLSGDTPALFARFCHRVAEHLGDGVGWFATINEPGALAYCGYLGYQGFPPGLHDVAAWQRVIANLCAGHLLARGAVKEMRPDARVGLTHSMAEWESAGAGRPMMEYLRRQMEDVFLDVCEGDDYIGVQTYTRTRVEVPRVMGPAVQAMVRIGLLNRWVLPRVLRSQEARATTAPVGEQTDMGYEYRPQAVAVTVRRVAERFPGKDIVVTEHGIATDDDVRRVGFIAEGLTALHALVEDGIPLRGYVHWSAFDNFEWALGYRMHFGLIGVDRATQERHVRPSARFLGEIARMGSLVV